MFALSDMIVIEAIEHALQNLRDRPHHLEYILHGFAQSAFQRKTHGTDFVKNAMSLVIQNKILVEPYYRLDTKRLPSIAVLATYDETEQFLGDYGSTCAEGQEPIQSTCLLNFDATQIVGKNSDELKVSKNYNIAEVARPGMVLVQDGKPVARIIGILQRDCDFVWLDRSIKGKKLSGFKLTTQTGNRVVITNSSINSSTVMLKLSSSGDIETHKVLCMVLRYCLRYSRLYMDNLGLQVSRTSQNMAVLEDPEQNIFATQFSLVGKITDTWIAQEVQNPGFVEFKTAVCDRTRSVAINLDNGDTK